MRNLRDIRRRIKSVRNTAQITKAMKMVSAAKLRRAEETMRRGRPYASALERIIASLARRCDVSLHPILKEREEKRIRLLVITSDRGLCGAFNTNLLKYAYKFIKEKEKEGKEIEVDLIGKKGRDFFKRREVKVVKFYSGLSSKPNYDEAKEIAEYEIKSFLENHFDALYLIYNEFKTLITQKITTKRIIPAPISDEKLLYEEWVEFEPQEEDVLNSLLEKQISFTIFQALLESFASEQGARMSAMENATKSALEMIDKLTLLANRIRQTSITKEIIEIVSGAEALKSR